MECICEIFSNYYQYFLIIHKQMQECGQPPPEIVGPMVCINMLF